jgi:hypothetical protein
VDNLDCQKVQQELVSEEDNPGVELDMIHDDEVCIEEVEDAATAVNYGEAANNKFIDEE